MPALRLLCGLGAVAVILASSGLQAEADRKSRRSKRVVKAGAAEAKQPALRTNQVAPLYERPGESSALVARVPAGKRVKVLKRSGRWLYVRVAGKRGWLTRTTVEQRVTKDDDSRPRAEKQDYRSEAWSLEDDRAAERPRVAAAEPASREIDEVKVPDAPPPPLRNPRLALAAGVGYRSIGIDFTSDGSAGIGNYLIAMGAMTTTIGGRARVLGAGSSGLEIDGEYRFTYGRPGIHYQSSAGPAGDIPFVRHEVDAGASIGTWIRPGGHPTRIAARGGYHYGAFLVDDVANVGMLPSESLAGPVAGARVRVQPHGARYQLRGGLDALIAGVRSQTDGLEDGMSSSASALWARAGANLPLSIGVELELAYVYERATTTWSGPSSRQGDATSAQRIDISHLAYVGIGRAF